MTDIRQIVSRLFGWVPPTDAVIRALKFVGAPAPQYLGATDEAESVDLSDRVVVQDQGNLGSCVAQAVCQAIHSEMAPAADFPSRLWAYQLALAAQGTTGQDVGTNLATCFDALAAHGFPRERHWPYDVQALNQRVTPAAWRMSIDQRATVGRVNYHPIVGDVPAQVRQALTAGHLVAFGTRVDDAFASNSLVPVIEPPELSTTVGGHALVCSGYQRTPAGTIYQIANSWGPDWGNGGFCWFSEAYLTAPYSADFWFCSAAPSYSDEVQP